MTIAVLMTTTTTMSMSMSKSKSKESMDLPSNDDSTSRSSSSSSSGGSSSGVLQQSRPKHRSQLSNDLAFVNGPNSDDLAVSRDIFDFDEFFLQPAVMMLNEELDDPAPVQQQQQQQQAKPFLQKRSISVLDTARTHHSHHPLKSDHTSMSNANFQFDTSKTLLPKSVSTAVLHRRLQYVQPLNGTSTRNHTLGPSSSTSNAATANNMFPGGNPNNININPLLGGRHRTMSVRNVADLKRTRDKLLGGGIGSNHTPFYALKNLAKQRAADVAAASAANKNVRSNDGGAGGYQKVQVASVLNSGSGSNFLLDMVRHKSIRPTSPAPHPRAPTMPPQQQIPPSSLSSSLEALKRQHLLDDDDGTNDISSSNSSGRGSNIKNNRVVMRQEDPMMTVSSSQHVPPHKKSKPMESPLHRACCRPNVTTMEIYQLLQRDPTAASRSERIQTKKMVYDRTVQRRVERLVYEPYTLPLNLAICYRQSNQVLDMIMNVAPSVLTTRDGVEREGPLSILLKYSPHDTDTVDRMLLLSPKCVALRDRKGNSPAHVACMRNTALDAVRHICIMYPESLRMKNAQGYTPLRLAELYTRSCSEAVCTFLWEHQKQQQQQQQVTSSSK